MEYFGTCVFLRYFKKIEKNYIAIEEKVSITCLNSSTYALVNNAFRPVKIGLKFSIFSRLKEIEKGVSIDFFETCKIIKIILNLVSEFKPKLIGVFNNSKFFVSIRALKRDFCLNFFKIGGIIIIVAISTNLFLSVILSRQITLWGWFMRGVFLLIGIGSFFCNSSWEDVKKTSKINKILTQGNRQ